MNASPTTARVRLIGGLVAVAALGMPLVATPAVAAPAVPVQAAAGVCLANVHIVQLYVPADIGGLSNVERAKLKQVDFDADRGWKVAELRLRQELRTNAGRTAVQSVTAYASPFTTGTAGALGATATVVTKENGATGAATSRSQATFNVALSTPFGAWNPSSNYQIAILANVNGYFDYSPMRDDPARGIYVQPQAQSC
jgi:hypothetical protein